MKTITRTIYSISIRVGKVTSWLVLALILALVYEVTSRHVFDAPTIWAHEVAPMLAITIFCIGFAYTHSQGGHVRIDVFYTHFPDKVKGLVETGGFLFFYFPLLALLIWVSTERMLFSWEVGEKLMASYWYPPAGPIRTVLVFGLTLFLIQGLAVFIRDLSALLRGGQIVPIKSEEAKND